MAKDPAIRHIVLSMPQRLAIARATPEVRAGRGWKQLEAARGAHPATLVPATQLRGGFPAKVVELGGLLREAAQITGSGRIVFPDGTVPAAAISGLAPRGVRSLLRRADIDCAWHAAGGRVSLIYREGGSVEAAGHADDPSALSEGASLRDIVQRISPGAPAPDVPWTSASEVGWVPGGSLGVACEKCPKPLLWCDWWHLKAMRSRNTWYAYCPVHGGPVGRMRSRGLVYLVDARRQLDSATWVRPSGGARECYVFEVDGLGAQDVYVGETTRSVASRFAQHGRGHLAARILKRAGASPGELRPDLIGDLPQLVSKYQALAAEQWVATRLRYLDYTVHGGH